LLIAPLASTPIPKRALVGATLGLIASVTFGTGADATVPPLVAGAPTHRTVPSDASAPADAAPRKSVNCWKMATVRKCVMAMLAPAAGTHGVYLQRIGGPVLAADNASFAFEPASSIKAVIALYAITQVEKGRLSLGGSVPKIDGSGGTADCPPSTFAGTEPLGTAIQQMMEVSDNNRTEELMRYFGVGRLNALAASLGMRHTMFRTSPEAPGFNVIGCLAYGYNPLPGSVDGNTMSLEDAARLWAAVTRLPAPYADAFYELSAGRDMFNSQGYDFTGVWPVMETIAREEAPPGLSPTQVGHFIDHMTVSVKGGSYDVVDCAPSCEQATWWVFAGNAEIPSCRGATMMLTQYTWGYFVNDAVAAGKTNPDDTVAGRVFLGARGQLLAAPIEEGLAHWWACAPQHAAALSMSARALSTGANVDIGTTLATLTDTDKTDIAPDLEGLIDWGDGSTRSDATVSGDDGRFTVQGWHTYLAKGVYIARVSITDVESGASATIKVKLKVT